MASKVPIRATGEAFRREDSRRSFDVSVGDGSDGHTDENQVLCLLLYLHALLSKGYKVEHTFYHGKY